MFALEFFRSTTCPGGDVLGRRASAMNPDRFEVHQGSYQFFFNETKLRNQVSRFWVVGLSW